MARGDGSEGDVGGDGSDAAVSESGTDGDDITMGRVDVCDVDEGGDDGRGDGSEGVSMNIFTVPTAMYFFLFLLINVLKSVC